MFLNVRYQVRRYLPTLITKLISPYPWISAPASLAITIDMYGLRSRKYLISLQKWVFAIVLYPQALINDRSRYSCDNDDK